MAKITTGKVIQVRFFTFQTELQQAGIIVRHWKAVSQAGTGGSGAAMLSVLDDTYPDLIKALLQEDAEYRGMILDYVTITPQPVSDVNVNGAGLGELTGKPAPAALAGVVTWRTAFAGRSFRGRTYFPFPNVDAVDVDSRPTTGYKTLLDDFADQYVGNTVVADDGGGNTTTLAPCVFSRLLNSGEVLTDYTVQSEWGQQHRRGGYGQLNVTPI